MSLNSRFNQIQYTADGKLVLNTNESLGGAILNNYKEHYDYLNNLSRYQKNLENNNNKINDYKDKNNQLYHMTNELKDTNLKLDNAINANEHFYNSILAEREHFFNNQVNNTLDQIEGSYQSEYALTEQFANQKLQRFENKLGELKYKVNKIDKYNKKLDNKIQQFANDFNEHFYVEDSQNQGMITDEHLKDKYENMLNKARVL